jgi:hypothetical protein
MPDSNNRAAEMLDRLITQRARHFGVGAQYGQWVFAADVACCVEERRPGRPTNEEIVNRVNNNPEDSKVTATEFAARAAVSVPTVTAYLRAWNLAASEGLLPHSSTLGPRDHPELPQEYTDDGRPMGRWQHWYNRANRRAEPPAPPSRPPADEHPPAPAPLDIIPQPDGIGVALTMLRQMAVHGHGVVARLRNIGEITAADTERIAARVAMIREVLDMILGLVGGSPPSDEDFDRFLREVTSEGEGGE